MQYAWTYNICICWCPIIGRWSPDCRPIVGRWTADDRPMQNRRVPMNDQLCLFLMWMRVIARFERVKLSKSADEHLKFWSPDHKFKCELGINICTADRSWEHFFFSSVDQRPSIDRQSDGSRATIFESGDHRPMIGLLVTNRDTYICTCVLHNYVGILYWKELSFATL